MRTFLCVLAVIAAVVGHSHIWKAAVAGAAVTNWVDQYSLADISTDFTAAFFGGSPWDPKYEAAYRAESPITYARAVRTGSTFSSTRNRETATSPATRSAGKA